MRAFEPQNLRMDTDCLDLIMIITRPIALRSFLEGADSVAHYTHLTEQFYFFANFGSHLPRFLFSVLDFERGKFWGVNFNEGGELTRSILSAFGTPSYFISPSQKLIPSTRSLLRVLVPKLPLSEA